MQIRKIWIENQGTKFKPKSVMAKKNKRDNFKNFLI